MAGKGTIGKDRDLTQQGADLHAGYERVNAEALLQRQALVPATEHRELSCPSSRRSRSPTATIILAQPPRVLSLRQLVFFQQLACPCHKAYLFFEVLKKPSSWPLVADGLHHSPWPSNRHLLIYFAAAVQLIGRLVPSSSQSRREHSGAWPRPTRPALL